MHRDRRGYFYRSKRVGTGAESRVVREYVGSGQLGAVLAEIDELESRQAQMERQLEQLEHEELQAQVLVVAELVTSVSCLTEAVARATLEAAGYHQHKRGEWRKKRKVQAMRTEIQGESATLRSFQLRAQQELKRQTDRGRRASGQQLAAIEPREASPLAQSAPQAEMDFGAVLQAANEGDSEAVRQLFKRVQGTPAEARLVGTLANLSQRARENIIEALTPGSSEPTPLFAEAMARQLKAMKADLSGPAPSALESLLVERILNCWLQVHQLEMLLNVQDPNATRAAIYLDKRLDRAHGRYLASIKALAQVRKLALPTPAPNVQINMAEQQIVAAQVPQVLAGPQR